MYAAQSLWDQFHEGPSQAVHIITACGFKGYSSGMCTVPAHMERSQSKTFSNINTDPSDHTILNGKKHDLNNMGSAWYKRRSQETQ